MPMSLPEDLVEQARRDRENQYLTPITSEIDRLVKEGFGGLEKVAQGAAQQVAPFTQLLSGGEIKIPTLDELTPEWMRPKPQQQSATAAPMTAPQAAAGQPSAMPTTQVGGADDGTLDESSPEAFRQSLADSAHVVAQKYDLPWQVIAAIPIQETGFRVSRLGREGNNLFSIKGEGPAGSMQFSEGAAPEDLNTPFRKYNNAAESFDDFGRLITTQPRYAKAVQVWRETRDPARFIEEVQKAGYATDWGDADGTGIPWWRKVVNISRDIPQPRPAQQRPRVTTPPPAEQAGGAEQQYAAGSWTPNQINAATSEGLDYETALAVCGPAAAIAFARKNGRNPSMQEAVALAREVGWTPAAGMAGPASQQKLLERMGVAARLVDGAPDWQAVAADVQRGNPVTISTPGHYFVAERYDPESGMFDFGQSAKVLKASGGRTWFRPEELANLGMGDARATLFIDNPNSPSPSVSAGRVPLTAAPASSPAPGAAAPDAAGVPPAPAASPPSPWANEQATGGLMLKSDGTEDFLPGDGGYAPTPYEQPFNPDDGAREMGYTAPGLQPGGGVTNAWGQATASTPQTAPTDPDQGPREATPGSVGSQPLPQTPNPMTYGPIEQSATEQGPQQPAPPNQIDRYVPTYQAQAAQVAPTMPSPAAGAVQSGIDAGVEAYNDPFFAAGPQPPRWVKIVSDAMQAFGAESAKNVARSLGVTDDEWFSVFGYPISRVDVAGFAGGMAADPTNYVGLNAADPLVTVARGAVRDFAPEAVKNVGRAVGGAVREGADALGRGLQGVGREVAAGLMDLNPAMTPRMTGDAGPGIGRAMADDAIPSQSARNAGAATPSGIADSGPNNVPNRAQSMPSQRLYHGTGSPFEVVDPSKFDENGLFGPGYYLTSDPRVANGYATVRAGQFEPVGANVRAVEVPDNLRLWDLDAPGVGSSTFEALDSEAKWLTGQRLSGVGPNSTPEAVYDAFVDRLISLGLPPGEAKAEVNRSLVRVFGFDGIKHTGGRRNPLMDDAGNPIEHDVTIIFPESLTKIRNAFSGEVGGGVVGPSPGPRGAGIGTQLATDAGNALAGSMVGAVAPADSNEERLRNTALGAAGFPVAGRLMRRAGGALGTPGIGPNGRPSKPTVEVLQQQLDGMRALIQRARADGNTDLERRAIDRAWQLESALVDARNARIDLEPRITSDVGRRMDELPLTEESASDFAGIGRERVSPSAAADLTEPSAVATDMSGRMNSAPSYTGRGAGIGAQAAADVGASLQGGVVGAAAGYGMPADSEEQRRQNALYGAATGMVGMPIAGRVVGRGMRGAGAGTRAGIVPPHVADQMGDTFPVRVPTDPKAIRAIESIGGTIDPQRGVTINVTRAQGPQAAGMPATRGGVFYEAVPEGGRSNFVRGSDDPTGVGGSQVIPARPTTFRSPLIVSDAPGAGRGFDDAMEQLGTDAQRGYAAAKKASQEAYQAAMRADQEFGPSSPEAKAARDNYIAAIEAADRAWAPKAPQARDINDAIRQARGAGPEGSEARAQALKEVVRRYGGDPELIDPLLRVRGADASESEWAIRENILAAHARRNGYDGVVTVEDIGVDEAAVLKHPAVVAAKVPVDQLADEWDEVAQQMIEAEARQAAGTSAANPYGTAEDGALIRDLSYRQKDIEQRQIEAEIAYMRALEQARKELPAGRITELIDVREGANPTPGKTNPRIARLTRELEKAKKEEGDWYDIHYDPADATPAEMRQLDSIIARVKRYQDQLAEAQKTPVLDPGFSVRADIQRPPGAQWAGVPFDPASAAMGGAAGAMSENENGQQGDPLRTAAGILLAGVGGGMSPRARAALQQAMKKAEALKAVGRDAEAAAVVDAALRRTGGYDPRLSREPVLPGMEPPRGRVQLPNVSETPNRAPVLGDVPPSAVNQGALPGMDPLRDVQPRPLEDVVQEIVGDGSSRPIPVESPAGLNIRRLAKGIQLAAANPSPQIGLPGFPVPPPQASPNWWDLAQTWRYSMGLFGNISTALVQTLGGVAEVGLGAPAELVRQAVVRGHPEHVPLIIGEALKSIPKGVKSAGETAMGNVPSTIMAGSDYRPALSDQLTGAAKGIARAIETPGRVATQAPDSLWYEVFYRTGLAQAAAEQAQKKGASRLDPVGSYQMQQQFIENPTAEMIARAHEFAQASTYKGELGSVAKAIGKVFRGPDNPTSGLGKTWKEVGSFLMPVYHTVARIHEGALEYAPGVGMLPLDKLGLAAKGRPLDQKIAQQAVGLAAAGAMLSYAASGGVRGPGPNDPDKLQEMRDQGYEPNTTNVGGYWVPNAYFGRYGPILNAIGAMNDAVVYGDGQEKWNGARWDRQVKMVAKNFGRAFNDYPTAQAVSTLIKVKDDPAGALAEFAGGTAAQFVPAAYRTYATMTDAQVRRPDRGKDVPPEQRFSDTFTQRSGVGRQSLPVAQNSLGEPVENQRQGINALFPRAGSDRPNAVIQAFLDAGVDIGKPNDQFSVRNMVPESQRPPGSPSSFSVALTSDEQRRWNELRGQELTRQTNILLARRGWAEKPVASRQADLEAARTAANAAADRKMQTELGARTVNERIRSGLQKKAS